MEDCGVCLVCMYVSVYNLNETKFTKYVFLTEILYKIVFAYGGLLGGCYNCSYLMVKQRNICLVVVAGGFFFLLVIDRG